MPLKWAFLTYAVLLGFARGQNDTSITNGTDVTNTTASLAPSDCHCGFLDPLNGRAYTDSIIVYFNETGAVTDAFDVSSFENRYEKGWQVFYLQGAQESNIFFTNGSAWNISPGWLNLNVSAYTPEHLVNGAQMETKRQDMLFGSFRMLAQPPQPYSGGTAFGMRLVHNETNSAELDLLNMDDSGNTARYATTTNSMDPDPNNCVNYTYIVRPDSPGTVFWNFNEYRMDWNDQSIDWYIDTNMTRTMPSTNWTLPMSLSFKHWSTGDLNWMQGPPTNNTGGQIGWMRAFFNSSLATAAGQPEGCTADMYCSTEDESLRMTTAYPADATMRSEDLVPHKENKPSTAAIALAIVSVALTTALFVFGLTRRAVTRKQPVARPQLIKAHQSDVELTQLGTPTTFNSDASRTLLNARGFTLVRPADKHRSVSSQRPLLGQYDSYAASSMNVGAYPTPSPYDSRDPFMDPGSAPSQRNSTLRNRDIPSAATPAGYSDIGMATSGPGAGDQREAGVQVAGHDNVATQDLAGLAGAVPGGHEAVKPAAPVAAPGKPAAPVRTRVDYLAGLVAMCSLLVSCTHFMLTYVPSVIMEYLPMHYKSEYWARRTIEPFFFNEIWVGIFFTTSTRFLTTGYLRKGDLKIIAEKVVCRTPRLMIPIAVVILFEYFLMDVGATTYLEYIPSITWSTWPSTTVYNNLGWFINETLQLVYLIPNAAPQLTYNFCTGVLWTIPVQLQNTWTVLLGAVIVKEIKTPWKRWGYYAFCIINHWYAMSWGSYFWFGLLLADLDINFKYRTKIQSRATLLYPLITIASLLVFLSLGNDLLSVWTGWTFSTNERDIHPEIQSGLNIGSTAESGYPEYTEPKLNGLVFCVAAQFIVEISVWTQKFLSSGPFLLLFPHVFTMYLIHGLVQWSIGSLVCVYFAGIGMAYWLNILLTALITYACLFASLPIVTPVMEMLGKEMTKSIWIAASEEPPAWKPTTWPFEKEEVQPYALEQRRDQDHPQA